MGCHTWFYKKTNQPTLEEIKILLMKKNNQEIDFTKRMQAGKINKALLEAYPEWTPEYGIHLEKEVIKERQLFVNIQEITTKLLYKYASAMYSETENLHFIHNDTVYIEEGTHDLFRIHNYPEDILLSYKQTIDFICEKNVDITETNLHKLMQFWVTYKDNGLIKFG